MPLVQLSRKLNEIKGLAYNLNAIYASTLPGEDFHPTYLKNQESFRMLLNSAMKLEDSLGEYFRALAVRVGAGVDWQAYEKKLFGAESYTSNIFWQDEIMTLTTHFADNLDDAFDAGATDGQTDMGINLAYDSNDPEAIAALTKYQQEIATEINNTTKLRVSNSLKRSLTVGDDFAQALAKLQTVVADGKRAALIAHTEAVKTYTLGKIQVGIAVGATTKMWRDGQSGACVICRSLNQQTVPFDATFTTQFGQVLGPPAHGWCKCNLKVNAPKFEGSEIILGKATADGQWITLKNGRHVMITHGRLGMAYKNINNLVPHEWATDTNRIEGYKKLLASGHELAPLVVVKEGVPSENRWGVEDGKHRLEAYRQMGHTLIPTITKQELTDPNKMRIYDRMTQADHVALLKLDKSS